MSVKFSQTIRALNADRARGFVVGILTIGALVTAWAVWLLIGRVTVYAVSDAARIETDQSVYPIQTLYSGRIANTHVVLGQEVRRGDVLIELDANVQRLQLLEGGTRAGPREPQE